MMVLVNDANILIDLLKIDLLSIFLDLGNKCFLTDLVAAEIKNPDASCLNSEFRMGRLVLKTFSGQETAELVEWMYQYTGLSLADCSCLWVCEKNRALLLTGDAVLKRTAAQRGIEVHGILWVLDQLVLSGRICIRTACTRLRSLLGFNPRLPYAACQERLLRWCHE